MSAGPLLRVRAPAKINLSLRIVGTTPDGYHELRTVFQSLALHDTLTFWERPGPFHVMCDDPSCPADETNLVWRAAETIARAAGSAGPPRDIVIRIAKRIPMQAGLGGGSSDAAAALRGFAALWGVAIPRARMRALAAAIGADVPFFLEGGTALGLDRGDLVFPLIDAPAAWVTLVRPAFGVSTRAAFGWWDEGASLGSRGSLGSLGSLGSRGSRGSRGSWGSSRSAGSAGSSGWIGSFGSSGGLMDEVVNDLQPAVVRRHPEIARMISALRRSGASQAAMSGSGSAVFGLFASRASAQRAARALSTRSWRALVTRTVNRVQYQALAAS